MIRKVNFLLRYFYKKITKKKSALSSVAILYLSSCGSSEEKHTTSVEETNTDLIEVPNTSPTSFSLIANEINYGNRELKDVITANSDSFVAGTSLIDENPYDDDELTVTATADLLDAPIVSGIETITFSTSEATLGGDNEFDINLLNISEYNLIQFVNTNSSSLVNTVDLTNVGSNLSLGPNYTSAKIAAKENANIILSYVPEIEK